jgi:hypothetical protein
VELRWYQGGRLLRASGGYDIVGGRREGFRLWSSVPVRAGRPPAPMRLDVVTEGGQLIGRAWLPAPESPGP